MIENEQSLEKLADEKLSMGFMVRRELKKLPELLGETKTSLTSPEASTTARKA